MLSSGANVIIWGKCYHLVLSCDIIQDENTLLVDFSWKLHSLVVYEKSGTTASHMLNKQRYSFFADHVADSPINAENCHVIRNESRFLPSSLLSGMMYIHVQYRCFI